LSSSAGHPAQPFGLWRAGLDASISVLAEGRIGIQVFLSCVPRITDMQAQLANQDQKLGTIPLPAGPVFKVATKEEVNAKLHE
jgi:hypothetical protein